MRVKVILSGNLDLNQYEADAIVYQQVVENIGGKLMQVPGIVVKLDSGELKVQPLQMDNHVVEVFELNKKAVKTEEVNPIHTLIAAIVGIAIGILVSTSL